VTHTKALDVLSDAQGSTHRVAGAITIAMIGFALFAAAILGLAHMLHQRRPGLALLGGGAALAGLLAVTGVVATQGLVVFEAAQPGRDQAAMVSLLHDILEGSLIPLAIATELLAIGMVALALGLYATRAVARWMPAGVAVAALGLGAANPFASSRRSSSPKRSSSSVSARSAGPSWPKPTPPGKGHQSPRPGGHRGPGNELTLPAWPGEEWAAAGACRRGPPLFDG